MLRATRSPAPTSHMLSTLVRAVRQQIAHTHIGGLLLTTARFFAEERGAWHDGLKTTDSGVASEAYRNYRNRHRKPAPLQPRPQRSTQSEAAAACSPALWPDPAAGLRPAKFVPDVRKGIYYRKLLRVGPAASVAQLSSLLALRVRSSGCSYVQTLQPYLFNKGDWAPKLAAVLATANTMCEQEDGPGGALVCQVLKPRMRGREIKKAVRVLVTRASSVPGLRVPPLDLGAAPMVALPFGTNPVLVALAVARTVQRSGHCRLEVEAAELAHAAFFALRTAQIRLAERTGGHLVAAVWARHGERTQGAAPPDLAADGCADAPDGRLGAEAEGDSAHTPASALRRARTGGAVSVSYDAGDEYEEEYEDEDGSYGEELAAPDRPRQAGSAMDMDGLHTAVGPRPAGSQAGLPTAAAVQAAAGAAAGEMLDGDALAGKGVPRPDRAAQLEELKRLPLVFHVQACSVEPVRALADMGIIHEAVEAPPRKPLTVPR